MSTSPSRRTTRRRTTARGAFLADERTLIAVVDGRRLVALDLPTGLTHVRVSGVPLDGLGALDPSGLVLVGTQIGMLVGVDPAGNERVHVALEKPVLTTAGLTCLPNRLVTMRF